MTSLTVKQLKKRAREIQKETGNGYQISLELSSKENGFISYKHACSHINKGEFKVYFLIQKNLIQLSKENSVYVKDTDNSYLTSLYNYHSSKSIIDIDTFFKKFDALSFFFLNSIEIKDYQRAVKKIEQIFNIKPFLLIQNYEFIDIRSYEPISYVNIPAFNPITDRELLTGKTPQTDPYLWCMHCQRAYKNGEYRVIQIDNHNLEMCPYDDCDGDAVIDAWSWSKVRMSNAEYPSIPERDVYYPLYPSEKI